MSCLKLRRIPARFHAAITGTTLTVTLTGAVSLGLTLKNVGLTPDAPMRFLAAWAIATAIAVPARFLLLPLVTRLVGLVVADPALQRS